MGNEASSQVADGTPDNGLEPPSQISPKEAAAAAAEGTSPTSQQQGGARPGRALKNMFHRGHGAAADTPHGGHDVGRTLAANGHLSFRADSEEMQQPPKAPLSPRRAEKQQSIPPPPSGAPPPPQPLAFREDSAHPVVGVMYATEGSHRVADSSPSIRTSGKVVREGGTKLINAMKSLSIGQKMGRSPQNQMKQDENEWETRWDEDEDESDEEQEVANQKVGPASAAVAPPLRPGMDGGHSSSAPLTRPPEVAAQVPSEATKSVTIEEEMDDSLEWDTAAPTLPDAVYEKPNIQMFLPLLRVLGKGSFGKVVLCQKRGGQDRGGLYAMKMLRKTHLQKRRQIERTKTERKVLSVVDHPFIMKLHYAFQDEEKLYLVLDYCPGGELFFHLSRYRRFPERVARFFSAELLLAIGHLHKRGIIYRDLKPENVLLDADGHVKLGDFGLAKAGIKHPCEGAMSMCGTPEYMAPEVLACAGHGFCVDYWGLGMLLYEMMTGLPPWYTTDRSKLFRRLKSAPLDIPSYFSTHAANCVSGLLERNPRRRLGVTGIRTAMEQEFFRTINWRALYARRVEAPIKPCDQWHPPNQLGGAPSPDDATGTAVSQQTIVDMPDSELDLATANFDNTFTRMPVESEDSGSRTDASPHADDSSQATEELHENTFVGFTFDGENGGSIQAPYGRARPRTHNE